MNTEDYNQLKPYAKTCGYFVFMKGLLTIQYNPSTHVGWLSLLTLLGMIQLNSPSLRVFGSINIFVGISSFISYFIIKDKKRRLKLSANRFTISEDGMTVTDFNQKTIFIHRNEIDSFEVIESDTNIKHQTLLLKANIEPFEIPIMKSYNDPEKVNEAYLAIANYAVSKWD